jgi:sensor histidine kinase YesM
MTNVKYRAFIYRCYVLVHCAGYIWEYKKSYGLETGQVIWRHEVITAVWSKLSFCFAWEYVERTGSGGQLTKSRFTEWRQQVTLYKNCTVLAVVTSFARILLFISLLLTYLLTYFLSYYLLTIVSVYLYNPSNTTKENTLSCVRLHVSTSGSHHQAFLRA